MLAIAGGILIAALVIGAGWLGLTVYAMGDNEQEPALKGCGCIILLGVVAVAAYLIF